MFCNLREKWNGWITNISTLFLNMHVLIDDDDESVTKKWEKRHKLLAWELINYIYGTVTALIYRQRKRLKYSFYLTQLLILMWVTAKIERHWLNYVYSLFIKQPINKTFLRVAGLRTLRVTVSSYFSPLCKLIFIII